MSLLILNAGSSTLKVSLTDAHGTRVPGWKSGGFAMAEVASEADYSPAVRRMVDSVRAFIESTPDVGAIEIVVHRVVLGGTRFTDAVLIDAGVRTALAEVAVLAPLHNPPSLAAIDAAMAALPDVPHVAVFDTAFHATLAPEAYTYPLPREWSERWGIRRFGFHGASHAYCAERAAAMLSRPATDLRLIVAHLGNGASVTAIDGGRSVDTTMGFTPLEGLMMGTRAGSVDPGVLLYLLRQCGVSAEALEHGSQSRLGIARRLRHLGRHARADASRRQRATSVPRSPFGYSCDAHAQRLVLWRLPWDASMAWCSPPGSASTAHQYGQLSATGWNVLAWSWIKRSTRPHALMPFFQRPRRAAPSWSLRPGRT